MNDHKTFGRELLAKNNNLDPRKNFNHYMKRSDQIIIRISRKLGLKLEIDVWKHK